MLADLDATARTAFLGDMLELGATEVADHRAVLETALSVADRVVAVGDIMGKAVASLDDGRLMHYATSRAVADAVRSGEVAVERGEAVLVKGSQGTRMERVSEALLAPSLDPADVLPRQSPQWKAIP